MVSDDKLKIPDVSYRSTNHKNTEFCNEDRLMSASTYSLFDHIDCPPEDDIEIQQFLLVHEDYEKKQENSTGITYQEEQSEVGMVFLV